jgi:molybdopterin converting factor small subunit
MSVASDQRKITVVLSGALSDYCGSARELAIAADGVATVRDALARLEADHSAVYRGVCDETGAVRQHVGVFVNESHIRDENGLDTPLGPDDTLTILPAVSGG